MIAVQKHDFDIKEEYDKLSTDNSQGAIVTFVGKVRDFNQGDQVGGLSLEHYPGMTEKALEDIAKQAMERWPISEPRIIHRVGDLALQRGARETAEAAHRESMTIRRALVATDPGNAQWQRDLALGLDRMGDLQRLAGDTAAALAAHEEALRITRALVAMDPQNTLGQRSLAVTLNKIGDLRRASETPDAALAAYDEALA